MKIGITERGDATTDFPPALAGLSALVFMLLLNLTPLLSRAGVFFLLISSQFRETAMLFRFFLSHHILPHWPITNGLGAMVQDTDESCQKIFM